MITILIFRLPHISAVYADNFMKIRIATTGNFIEFKLKHLLWNGSALWNLSSDTTSVGVRLAVRNHRRIWSPARNHGLPDTQSSARSFVWAYFRAGPQMNAIQYGWNVKALFIKNKTKNPRKTTQQQQKQKRDIYGYFFSKIGRKSISDCTRCMMDVPWPFQGSESRILEPRNRVLSPNITR